MIAAQSRLEIGERAEATEPPEARGLARDEVRMLVARRRGEPRLQHARFLDLPSQVRAGDLLVVNTSATLPAALPARRAGGEAVDLHLSTPLPGAAPDSTPLRYVVELRRERRLLREAVAGERLVLPRGASAELVSPYLGARRLWVAELRLPRGLTAYLEEHGRPISYGYLRSERPLSDYRTLFGTEPGSAEMPSAGRPFTPRVLAALIAHGVAIAPITLHTGVSSLERGERPYPEWFRVPAATARLVNATRSFGGGVIAVGTTVVRALESAAGEHGALAAREGWTHLTIGADSPIRAVDGLVTGWHDPEASHLDMLEAIAGRRLITDLYASAARHGYRWHEFGDVGLILR